MQNIKIPFSKKFGTLEKNPYWYTDEQLIWKDNFETVDTFRIDTENYVIGSRYASINLIDSTLQTYLIPLWQFMKIVPQVRNGYWTGTICYSKHGRVYGCEVVTK